MYALWTYHWRAAQIRKGSREPYDDRLGPVSAFSIRMPRAQVDMICFCIRHYCVLLCLVRQFMAIVPSGNVHAEA